jgi:ArsR family transcriptional regulator, arsenate/arsenite/antimonite-responsive transcriptional repressor
MPAIEPKTEDLAARRLASLGNRTRLRLYKLLVKAGPVGLNVGDLQGRLGVPPSTLAHHLSTLAQAGLIIQNRRGREVTSTANYGVMTGLVTYLADQCCVGLKGACDPEEDFETAIDAGRIAK